MAEEIKVREIKDIVLILVDKKHIQRYVYTVIFHNIVGLSARRNILRSCQTPKKKFYSKRRLLILIIFEVIVKIMMCLLIFRHS